MICRKKKREPPGGRPGDNSWEMLFDEEPNYFPPPSQIGAQMVSKATDSSCITKSHSGTTTQALKLAIDRGHDYGTEYQEIYEAGTARIQLYPHPGERARPPERLTKSLTTAA